MNTQIKPGADKQRQPMSTNFPALALIVWSLAGCDAQVVESTKQPSSPDEASTLARQKWIDSDRTKGEIDAHRETLISSLRADLAAPWNSLVIALRYDCSCTGTSYSGFRISREADGFSVCPWGEIDGGAATKGLERTGDSRQLSNAAVEKLLSEAALFYLAATLSESVIEKVGRRPSDSSRQVEWRERYLAAGGSLEASDWLWIDIRVVTSEGLKRHSNMWGRNTPSDFSTWITAFGEPPRR
jgi:hypothetical protein